MEEFFNILSRCRNHAKLHMNGQSRLKPIAEYDRR